MSGPSAISSSPRARPRARPRNGLETISRTRTRRIGKSVWNRKRPGFFLANHSHSRHTKLNPMLSCGLKFMRHGLFLLGFCAALLHGVGSFAAPANDQCSGAIVV